LIPYIFKINQFSLAYIRSIWRELIRKFNEKFFMTLEKVRNFDYDDDEDSYEDDDFDDDY